MAKAMLRDFAERSETESRPRDNWLPENDSTCQKHWSDPEIVTKSYSKAERPEPIRIGNWNLGLIAHYARLQSGATHLSYNKQHAKLLGLALKFLAEGRRPKDLKIRPIACLLALRTVQLQSSEWEKTTTETETDVTEQQPDPWMTGQLWAWPHYGMPGVDSLEKATQVVVNTHEWRARRVSLLHTFAWLWTDDIADEDVDVPKFAVFMENPYLKTIAGVECGETESASYPMTRLFAYVPDSGWPLQWVKTCVESLVEADNNLALRTSRERTDYPPIMLRTKRRNGAAMEFTRHVLSSKEAYKFQLVLEQQWKDVIMGERLRSGETKQRALRDKFQKLLLDALPNVRHRCLLVQSSRGEPEDASDMYKNAQETNGSLWADAHKRTIFTYNGDLHGKLLNSAKPFKSSRGPSPANINAQLNWGDEYVAFSTSREESEDDKDDEAEDDDDDDEKRKLTRTKFRLLLCRVFVQAKPETSVHRRFLLDGLGDPFRQTAYACRPIVEDYASSVEPKFRPLDDYARYDTRFGLAVLQGMTMWSSEDAPGFTSVPETGCAIATSRSCAIVLARWLERVGLVAEKPAASKGSKQNLYSRVVLRLRNDEIEFHSMNVRVQNDANAPKLRIFFFGSRQPRTECPTARQVTFAQDPVTRQDWIRAMALDPFAITQIGAEVIASIDRHLP